MRKFLSHVFVLLVNYYFLTSLLAVVLIAVVAAAGPIAIEIPVVAVLGAFLVVLGYQLTRSRWRFQSIGEQLLGSTSKDTILDQRSEFTVSRGPLLLMFVLTLMLNGNLADGLTSQMSYTIADVLILAIVWLVEYQGFRTFTENPNMVAIVTLAALLFALGIAIQGGYRKLVSEDMATLAGHYVVGIYKGLAVIWIMIGLYYRNRYQLPK
ncbi:hypothetical protein ACFST9_00780 [Hymenobacter monticola]|uniref:Uncharacterized protein n=1 Tax=Hymenobacter monticola TaxID=1705399 RepID=A0ABY4B2Y2_9BACT|nr:hypothetical protein [Hymenobacter monticola]UOE33501.1 hypothetical protein MTP16_20550 [Hymenobacter monticola]